MTTLRGTLNSPGAPRSLWQKLALCRPQETRRLSSQDLAGGQETLLSSPHNRPGDCPLQSSQ